MKVIESQNFNQDYPETFAWGRIDSVIFSNISNDLANWINHDLRTTDRNLVPGLRKALNLIAEQANL